VGVSFIQICTKIIQINTLTGDLYDVSESAAWLTICIQSQYNYLLTYSINNMYGPDGQQDM